MKKGRGQTVCAAVVAVLICILCGCSYVSADELYSLPQVSENYILLQEAIDSILSTGAEYSSPVSGSFRQAVQLRDLDGDGRQEALAFMTGSGDKPLKLYIFRDMGERYEVCDVIEGTGTAFESLNYCDLDGDGINEMLVGFRMGNSLQQMNTYSIRALHPTLLFSVNYSRTVCGDLTGDGVDDILVIRTSQETNGEAELISMTDDGEVVSSTALISGNTESVSRLAFGALSSGRTAVFADSVYSDGETSGVITDIFTWDNGIKNITLDAGTLTSTGTLRNYNVYCRDIDGDKTTEVPQLRALPSQTTTAYRVIDWYGYSDKGQSKYILTTYHNYSDSWYLILPESWSRSISVSRSDVVPGERTLIFSYYKNEDTKPVDFLRIFTLSGENRNERAGLNERFILKKIGDTVYAAEILPGAENIPLSVTRDEVLSGFRIIYSEWKS